MSGKLIPLWGSSAAEVRFLAHREDLRLILVEFGHTLGTDPIFITPQGPVLQMGGNLAIAVTGQLSFRADSIELHSQKDINICSGGKLQFVAQTNVEITGSSQTLIAKQGDIDLKANDDVMLHGERVRLNC